MEVEVVSKFSFSYFLYGIIGSLYLGIPALFTDLWLFFANSYNLLPRFILAIVLNFFAGFFIYVFSKGWKKITIGPSGIIVDYLFKREQIIIPYDSITHIYRPVYRMQRSQFDTGTTSEIIIEYNNTSLSFKPDYYTNYNELRATLYNYKYGFDRQRSKY